VPELQSLMSGLAFPESLRGTLTICGSLTGARVRSSPSMSRGRTRSSPGSRHFPMGSGQVRDLAMSTNCQRSDKDETDAPRTSQEVG
jgi:hypothetical protein